jgi:hypothetical protein
MDYVATRTGDRLTVRHADRWTITHTEGARLADIANPDGQLVDAVQVLEWDWAPVEGGPSRAVGAAPATVDSLSAALLDYVQTHSA